MIRECCMKRLRDLGPNEVERVKTLIRPTIDALDIDVNQHLARGWELCGDQWNLMNEDYKPTFFQRLRRVETRGRKVETK